MILERQLKHISIAKNGCWIWLGSKTTANGYGRLYVNGKRVLAHRAFYEHYVGLIPEGMNALHKCDNPPRVNPKHIFLGTQKDNALDMVSMGRHTDIRGTKAPWAKLDDNKAREIRERYKNGESIATLFRIYGVTRKAIRCVVQNKTWRHA